jgi:hypothetical protein
MKISRFLVSTLALVLVLGITSKAQALDHVKFYVNNNITAYGNDVSCIGPWGRFGNGHVAAGVEAENFYTADVTIFSPYGDWCCCSGLDCMSATGTGIVTCGAFDSPVVRFTLNEDSTYVWLNINSAGSGFDPLTVDQNNSDSTLTNVSHPESFGESRPTASLPDGSDISIVVGILGDDHTKRKNDRDTWRFQGTGGDTVTIILKPDFSAGSKGSEATLRLKRSGEVLESVTGNLPNEITTTLPDSGLYKLVVDQDDIPSRFIGSYVLRMESEMGQLDLMTPSKNVEHF